ncbi:MAG: tryptophan synthase subunit alpha, partial [Actinobacteria bacterium]|nr:tryptophan synthase subunit alpha [Actinomycetota bacterium]
VADVMKTVAGVTETGAPTLVMSYWNPIERYGVDRFATELAGVGGVGVITPDLTPEESGEWTRATNEHAIDRVFLVAPSSTTARLEKVTNACSGFVYAASTMGVTGARTSLSSGARTLVERVRDVTSLPVCVGVGVSTAEQASEVASYADGVIVGSAFVKALQGAKSSAEGAAAAAALAADLAAGVRAGRRHA